MLFVFAVCATLTVADYSATAGAQNTQTSAGEQADLSGTYTGTVNYPEGGLSGEATLTITGNQFTLASGANNMSGTVNAVTTRGYTGVTMTFAEATAAAPATRVSVRARRMGNNGLMLTSVQGERREFSFSTSGRSGMRGGGRRGRRGTRGGNMNSGMDGNMNSGGSMNGNMGGNMNSDMSGNMNSTGDMSGNMNSGNMN